MKHFPSLRTRRLTVQLKELTIGDGIKLAAMPDHLHESATTAFLRCAIDLAQGIEDPLHWTVQERIFAVGHYLAAVSEDGPDFALGNGRYTDYLDGSSDTYIDAAELGEIAGDFWTVTPLTGALAESIERMTREFDLPGRLCWLIGGMAAQLHVKGQAIPEFASDSQRDEWLLGRMRVFNNYPETDFEHLVSAYYAGLDALHHLFTLQFGDKGIVVLPRDGAEGGLPPARFPVSACLSQTTLDLAG